LNGQQRIPAPPPEQLAADYAHHKTIAETAKHYGVCTGTMNLWMLEAGIQWHRRTSPAGTRNGTIGPTIRALRREHGMSVADLADCAGLNARTLRNWETGRIAAPVEDLDRALAVFGFTIAVVNIDHLGGREDPPPVVPA